MTSNEELAEVIQRLKEENVVLLFSHGAYVKHKHMYIFDVIKESHGVMVSDVVRQKAVVYDMEDFCLDYEIVPTEDTPFEEKMTESSEGESPRFLYQGRPATVVAVYRDEEAVVLIRDDDGNNHAAPYKMIGNQFLRKIDDDKIFEL